METTKQQIATEDSALKQAVTFFDGVSKIIANSSQPLQTLLDPLRQFAIADPVNFRPNPDVPMKDTVIFMAHNAYNIAGTGITSVMPNQQKSLTELLEMGVRGVELDVYSKGKDFLLCHALCNQDVQNYVGFNVDWLFGQNRSFVDALKEIVSFKNANPREVIIIKLEDHVGSNVKQLASTVKSVLGESSIFTSSDLAKTGNVWPSLGEIASMDKSYILMTENLRKRALDPVFINTPHNDIFAVSRYSSLHGVLKDGFTQLQLRNGQMLEVGEDGTTLGTSLEALRKLIPGIDKYVGKGGGQFTREQIQEIMKKEGIDIGEGKKHGAILGLDNMSERDPRFVEGLLVELHENCRYFIPAAVLGAVLVAGCDLAAGESKKLAYISKPTKLAVSLLVHALLPIQAVFLYHTVEGGIDEFSKQSSTKVAQSMQAANESIVSKFGHYAGKLGSSLLSGVGSALDVTAKMMLASAIASIRGPSDDSSFAENTANACMNAAMANLLVEGAKGAVSYVSRKIW